MLFCLRSFLSRAISLAFSVFIVYAHEDKTKNLIEKFELYAEIRDNDARETRTWPGMTRVDPRGVNSWDVSDVSDFWFSVLRSFKVFASAFLGSFKILIT